MQITELKILSRYLHTVFQLKQCFLPCLTSIDKSWPTFIHPFTFSWLLPSFLKFSHHLLLLHHLFTIKHNLLPLKTLKCPAIICYLWQNITSYLRWMSHYLLYFQISSMLPLRHGRSFSEIFSEQLTVIIFHLPP